MNDYLELVNNKNQKEIGNIKACNELIVMPKDIPHAVYGKEKFKMLLVVSF